MPSDIYSQRPHTLSAPQTNLHLDILMGRDQTLDFSDVFLGRSCDYLSFISSKHFAGRESGPTFDIHDEIRKRVRS